MASDPTAAQDRELVSRQTSAGGGTSAKAPSPGAGRTAATTDRDDRWVALVLRNIEIARERADEAIRSGEAPADVLNRTLDFARGFVDGSSGLIVPPDMIDPAELDEAVALGRELAERYRW